MSKIGVQLQGDDATAIACRQEIDDSIQEFVKQGTFFSVRKSCYHLFLCRRKRKFLWSEWRPVVVGILLGGESLIGTVDDHLLQHNF